jgi:hypothetical protein
MTQAFPLPKLIEIPKLMENKGICGFPDYFRGKQQSLLSVT